MHFWYDKPIRRQANINPKLRKLLKLLVQAERMVKTVIYLPRPQIILVLKDLEMLVSKFPTRTIIPDQVWWKGCLVEIAPKLLSGDSKLKIETIETSGAPEPVFHEPQAVKAGDFLFYSGQMACNEKGVAPEALRHPNFPYYGNAGKLQMEYIMKNVTAISEAAGTTTDNICNRIAFHDNFNDGFQESIDTFFDYLPAGKRAIFTLNIGGINFPGCRV